VKIAVFHNLPSGGAKRALYGFVKYLKNVGNQIDVHVPSTANENYLPLKDIVDGFHVYPVRRTMAGVISSSFQYFLPTYASSLLVDFMQAQERIAKEINGGPYDVVLSEQDQYTMTPFLLRYLKKPTVYACQQPCRLQEAVVENVARSQHSIDTLPTYKKIWRAHIKRRLTKIDKENASYAKYILANSYFSRETILRAYGLNSFVSYQGIDTALFRPLGLAKEHFILSVGACFPHKGYDFVLRSLSAMDKPMRPKMVIVANASRATWEAHLMQMAARLGVDLEIKMDISDHELVGLYNRAELFVSGAILEPFGLAPLEAMSCGTPVVAVKEGGVRETVLHKETGILTERDETEFAGVIVQLLKDHELRERLGRQGAEVVRDFWTLEKAGERLTRHLDRARSAGSPLPLIADEPPLL
jgi:glycosyltransferase involved in cell wall biosynthesis